MRTWTSLIATSAILLSACSTGPKVGTTGGSSGTSGTSSGTSSGSGSASDSGTTGATTDASSGGTTGGGVCDEFLNEPSGDVFTLELRNLTTEPIFVPPALPCATQVFTLTAAAGPDAGRWPTPDCTPTCEENMMDLCFCPGGCAAPTFVRLEPGGVYSATWPGLLDVQTSLPAECLADEATCQAGPCPVRRVAPDGDYNLTVSYATQPEACTPPTGDPFLCGCTPNADGWCPTEAEPGLDVLSGVTQPFMLPNADPIRIDVQ